MKELLQDALSYEISIRDMLSDPSLFVLMKKKTKSK